MTQPDTLSGQSAKLSGLAPFSFLLKELARGLGLYWSTAAELFKGSGVKLRDPLPEYVSFERNMFSLLFLYSYYRAGISAPRRVLYAAINQCLRGMVTGCDNLLDDEYKMTLDTDLPEQGTRFRSVLDIMASDRILYEILLGYHVDHQMTLPQVISVGRASLHCLLGSGAQEASEEQGISVRVPPGEVIRSVHHYKTGILFQSPWAVPGMLEEVDAEESLRLKEALYGIGMGCQLLDDMVDMGKDIQEHRHNYPASVIFHGTEREERRRLERMTLENAIKMDPGKMILEFSVALRISAEKALGLLRKGFDDLLAEGHREAGDIFINLIVNRIGAQDCLRILKDP